jgi:hypothetical protein
LDLLLDTEINLQNSLKALEDRIGPQLTLKKLDTQNKPVERLEAIRLGLSLFNQERYWESHEALESAWRSSSGSEKEVLQGLILLAASLVHLQKDEKNVAESVMKRAYNKLQAHEGKYFGVDTATLTDNVKKLLNAGQPEFFKIETEP